MHWRFFRREELRVICGTRGVPDTVAPFRAWRGSRDLVAQSPKFHAPAVANSARVCEEKSSTASRVRPERPRARATQSFQFSPCGRFLKSAIALRPFV